MLKVLHNFTNFLTFTSLGNTGFNLIYDCTYSSQIAAQIANSGRTQDPFMQQCLCQLWLTKAHHDLEIHVIHVPGIHMFLLTV